MSVPRPFASQLARGLLISTLAATAAAPVLAATAAPTVRTAHGCYLVRQVVTVIGGGFAPSRQFEVAIDGVDFGQSTTDAAGAFSVRLIPGGLPAGVAQHVDHLEATDGTLSAHTQFTVTNPAGARFLATSGNPHTLSAPFEIWDFSPGGAPRAVYLHYIAPSGSQRKTVELGQTSGQCGYLRTGKLRLFPFSPSLGTWTVQVDTRRAYVKSPGGPVARIRLQIR